MAESFDPYRKWLGIPPSDQPPHYYRLLGIGLFESDPEVISNAADRQMSHIRRFQSGKNAAISQRILNELALARVCLLSRDKKAEYDQQLRATLEAHQPPPGPPPGLVSETTGELIFPDTWTKTSAEEWLEQSAPEWASQPAESTEGIDLPFSTEPSLPFGIEADGMTDYPAVADAEEPPPFLGVARQDFLPPPPALPGMANLPSSPVGPARTILPTPPGLPGTGQPMTPFFAQPFASAASEADGISLPGSADATDYGQAPATLGAGMMPNRAIGHGRPPRRRSMPISGQAIAITAACAFALLGLIVWAMNQNAPLESSSRKPATAAPRRPAKDADPGAVFHPPEDFPKRAQAGPSDSKVAQPDRGSITFPSGGQTSFPDLQGLDEPKPSDPAATPPADPQNAPASPQNPPADSSPESAPAPDSNQMPAPDNNQMPAPDKEMPATDKEMPAADKEMPAADKEMPAADKEMPAADKEMPAADKEMPAGENEKPAVQPPPAAPE